MDAAPADAASDAGTDAALPTIACKNQTANPASFWQRCRASASSATGTDGLVVGNYKLSSSWKGCGTAVYIFGAAELIKDPAGNYFFRYYISRAPDSGGGAITANYHRYGTWLVEPGAGGAVRRTELCQTGKVGTKETGKVASDASTAPQSPTLTFTIDADVPAGTEAYQEVWERTP